MNRKIALRASILVMGCGLIFQVFSQTKANGQRPLTNIRNNSIDAQAPTSTLLDWTSVASSGSAGAVFMMSNGTISSGAFVSTGGSPLVETRKIKSPLPTIERVRLLTREVEPATNATEAYLKLANLVNLKSASTDELRILDAIHEADLKVYDFDVVDDFLYNQALKVSSQTRWVWKPMREADFKAVANNSTWRDVPGVGFLYPKLYARPIPSGTLEHVSAILAKLPEAVFMVSDYEVVKPDPFLAVTTPMLLEEHKIWIIDQWDEPAFSKAGGVAPKLRMSPTI